MEENPRRFEGKKSRIRREDEIKIKETSCKLPRKKKSRAHPRVNLLFLGELLCSDVRASQLDVEDTLHGTQDLLVGRSGTALEVLDDGDGGVALGGEFLLGHLVALVGTALLDGIGNLVADGLGLDNVVAAVDLGQVLALGGTGASGLNSFAQVRTGCPSFRKFLDFGWRLAAHEAREGGNDLQRYQWRTSSRFR